MSANERTISRNRGGRRRRAQNLLQAPSNGQNQSRSPNRSGQRIQSNDLLALEPGSSEFEAQTSQTSFFQASENIAISGGNFTSAGGHHINVTINANHPQAENEVPSEAPSSLVRHPQVDYSTRGALPVQRSCDIYYRHISVKGRGSPLWIPQANNQLPVEYRRKGIEIGDVGIITASGSFDFLFNIFLPADHPMHPEDLPEGFTPLKPPPRPVDIHGQAEFDENSYLASSSIQRSQHDNDLTGLSFESSDSEGAILTMPHGLNSKDLSNLAGCRKYVASHIENWYRYVNGNRGREVKNGDVRLVIGCDKTTAWGMATFVRSTAQQELRLKFKPMTRGNLGRTYGWEYSGMAEVRSGPGTREVEQLRTHPDSNPFEHENQCLFIRTLNVTLRDDVWEKLEASEFGTLDAHEFSESDYNTSLPTSLKTDASGKSTESVQKSNSNINDAAARSRSNETVQTSELDVALTIHPSKSINEYLLSQSTSARMAITEDIHWVSVVNKDDTVLPPHDAMLERILASHDITGQDDVVYLLPKLQGSSNEESVVNLSQKLRSNVLTDGSTVLKTRNPVIGPTLSLGTAGSALAVPTVKATSSFIDLKNSESRRSSISQSSIAHGAKSHGAKSHDGTTGLVQEIIPLPPGLSSGNSDMEDSDLGQKKSNNIRINLGVSRQNPMARILQREDLTQSQNESPPPTDVPRSERRLIVIDDSESDDDSSSDDNMTTWPPTATSRNVAVKLPESVFIESEGEIWDRPSPENIYDDLEKFFSKDDLDKPVTVILATLGKISPLSTVVEVPPAVQPSEHFKAKKSIRIVAQEQKKRIDQTSLQEHSMHKLSEPVSPSTAAPTTFKWVRGELIGRGSYGRVYLALNATTGEMIAVKQVEIPQSDTVQPTEVVQALRKESETLKNLDHPHIVQYLGIEETPTNLSMFLEYVPGGSIGRCLHKYGKFADNVTRSFTAQSLSGLEYLHSKGILHRDLKGDNILVEMSGTCKISDFGISQRMESLMDGTNTTLQGTVFWMAPEVLKVPEMGYNLKVDIWSIGCVVLEMWQGCRPWKDEDVVTVAFKLYGGQQAPPVPSDVVLSEEADDFRLKCFSINPEERPSAAELRKHPYLILPPEWTFTGFS